MHTFTHFSTPPTCGRTHEKKQAVALVAFKKFVNSEIRIFDLRLYCGILPSFREILIVMDNFYL